MAKVTFDFEANLATFKRQVSQIPGITQKEADGMVSNWKRANRALAKQDTKRTRDAKREAKTRAKAALEEARATARAHADRNKAMVNSGKQMGSLLGGTFGDLAAVTFDFGESVNGATAGLGGMGTAAVVTAGALAGVAFAGAFVGKHLFELANSAVEVNKELEEMGLTTAISDKQQKALDDYSRKMAELSIVSKQATVDIGSGFAPMLEDVSNVFIGLGEITGNTNSTLGDLIALTWENTKATARWAPHLWAVATALEWLAGNGENANIAIKQHIDATAEATKHADEWAESMAFQKAALITTGMLVEDTEKKTKKSTATTRTATKANDDFAKGVEGFQKALDEAATAAENTASKLEKLEGAAAGVWIQWRIEANKAFDDMLIGAAESAAAFDNMALALEGIKKSTIDMMLEAGAVTMDLGTQAADIFADNAAYKQQVIEEQAVKEYNNAKRLATFDSDNANASIDKRLKMGKINEQQANAERRQIKQTLKEELKAARLAKTEKRKLALKAFKSEKRAAKSSAIMLAAGASMKAMLQFGAPPSPLGIAALAAIGMQLGASLSAIKRQSPPQFPTGVYISPQVDPDHTTYAALQPGETVLNRRATRNIGGEQGANMLNNGAPMGQPSPTIETLIIQLDPRETRNLLSGKRASVSIGQTDIHRGGRYGR